ncbi:acyl-CoA dehydrogenase family protein [Clostridium sp. OS1-26]|uniref:acyl-CoA dehydrogenase family protein n=1 Tax=Clostridium sp. OS1-26 TaxID=3070681 RepID=UPI0027E143FA|nr:acyl-CoA dehydrogenase family protein [Clostridium sp. OS1-26]WML37145.1 acyl-CoA dehydrogenase family protein [Clostridium sp. OS1-26]
MDINKEMLFLDVREFCEKYIKPIAKQLDEVSEFPKKILKPMRELKLFSMHYPKEYGGLELDYETSFGIIREISKYSAGIGLLYAVHWMAADVLLKYGTERQKGKYLKDLVEGNKIAAYAISEPTAGSDAAGIRATALKDEGFYILNGKKYFCTNGSLADIYIIACKTDEEKGAKGISLFILEKGTKGMEITNVIDKMGCRSSITTDLVLKECRIPSENMLGEENKGFKIAMDGLVGGRLGMCAIGIGISEAALNKAIQHSNNRIAFGKPISSLYSIQSKISNMYIKLEASKALFKKTCEVRNSHKDYSMEASVAKVFIGETVNIICYEAIQIMGGHGYVRNNEVERFYRDGRLIDIGVGTSEVLNMVIGSTILKMNSAD